MDIGLVINAVTLIVAVVAIIETYRIARRQEEQEITWKLSSYLTAWYGDLRDAIRNNDSQRLEDIKRQLEDFMGGVTYEGQFDLFLKKFKRYPKVVEKVRNFKETALDFKQGAIVTLKNAIAGYSHWNEDEYERKKAEELKRVQDAYYAVMNELGKL